MRKENKNNNFIQEFVSSVSPWRHFGEYHISKQRMYTDTLFTFRSKLKQCKQHICVNTLHTLFTYVILSKMVPGWRGGDKLLNKVVIFVCLFVFLCTKSILVASQNYGWTSDVTWIILRMSLLPFWTLIVLGSLLSMGGSESSRNSSKIS